MFLFMWGWLESCGGVATRLERRLPGYPLGRAQLAKLPRIAASRKRWRFSEGRSGASKGGRRINNPPQVNNLPREHPQPRLGNSPRHATNLIDSSTKKHILTAADLGP